MSDLRAALENAFDEVVEPVEETTDVSATASADPVEAPQSDAPADSPSSADGDAGTPPAHEAAATDAPAEAVTKTPAKPASDDKLAKAPGSWKPAAREKWAGLDPEVRAEIYRREAEVSRGLNQYQTDAKFGRELQDTIKPFEHTMRAAGVEPQQAIRALLETDHSLRFGTPVEKAQRVLEIMNFYGVNVDTLGAVLQGAPQPEPVDPKVAQLQARLAQLEQGTLQQQSQVAAQLKSEVESFAANPANEFYRDVREQMATLLESGVATDLQDAYDKATWANPEVRKVLLQRQAAELSSKVSQTAARARNASSSIRSSGEPIRTSVDPSNLRAVLEAAWDSQGNRL